MLTDAKIKAAKPGEKDYKLGDAGQLYLFVSTAGGKIWRINYTFGKNAKGAPAQKTLTLGHYPRMTLVEARKARDAAKEQLSQNIDPMAAKRAGARKAAISAANTFKLVAIQWFELQSGWSVEKFHAFCKEHGSWSSRNKAKMAENATHWIVKPQEATWSIVHAHDTLRSLERDVFPEIGELPVAEIDSPAIVDVLGKISGRGAIETAHRVCQRVSDIYVYAVSAGFAKSNPAATMSKALPKVPRSKKQPSIIDKIKDHDEQVKAVRQLLRDCENERCRATTKFALRLLMLTSVRPNELENGEWDELEDLDGPEPLWRIPAARMKGDQERKAEEEGDHLVPLSRQAVDVIRALRLLTGNHRLMFPGERDHRLPISNNALRQLLMRAGYYKKHVPHGCRAAMSTIMNQHPDKQKDDRDIIDLMLAHIPQGKSGSEGAYNRAEYMPRRREIAQAWADLIIVDLEPPEAQIGRPIRWAETGPRAARELVDA
jgi:integrase